ALLDNCTGAAAQWLDALTQVTQAASPFLTTPDVAVIFARAKASKCYQSLNEVQRRHVAWLQAINDLDAGAMYSNAEFLLRNTPEGQEPEHAYYVLSALTGAVASGRIAEARALRDRYVPRLPKRNREALALDLVLAHIAQRSSAEAK
ncbi:MAG TPA: hypothetical protein VII36_03120, partial [Usitatibacter sp.]